MAELGGSLMDESVEAEAARDDIVTPDPDVSSGTTRTDDGIEQDEFQSRSQNAERTPRASVSLLRM